VGPLVALDPNVLAAAFLSPTGLSRRLLVLALLGEFEAIITTEVLAELDRHCRRGFKGRVPTDEQISRFRAALHPLLEQMELLPGPVGRAVSEGGHVINIENRITLRAHPGGHGGKRLEVVSAREVLMRDMGDAHLLAAAIAYGCRYLCSWNTADFPPGLKIGELELITPEGLLAHLENGEL
jgi:predicted nucleic acid-binding protein